VVKPFVIFTVALILGLAFIMNCSGMSSMLGLACKAGEKGFLFSPVLGWIGVFLTGSDTSSNALLGSLVYKRNIIRGKGKPMEQADILALLKQKAEAVQTVVVEIGRLTEAFEYAISLTEKQGGATIAAPGLDEQKLKDFRELCGLKQISLLSGNLREHLSAIHTGFTIADWCVAETATLVMDSTRESVRIATMLSEIHVAVVPRSRVVNEVALLEGELTQLMKSAPSYTAFISGASRTADIERVLTIGVHGPQELHILLMEDSLL